MKSKELLTAKQKDKLEEINARVQQKLEGYQELYDSNQRLIYLGQKINDLSEKYFINKKKKDLIGELLKIVEIENSKRKKETPKEKRSRKLKKKRSCRKLKRRLK